MFILSHVLVVAQILLGAYCLRCWFDYASHWVSGSSMSVLAASGAVPARPSSADAFVKSDKPILSAGVSNGFIC
jgi:hypothetical protein